MQRFQLSVNVSDTLTLEAGWWEETMEETALGKPLPCRLIHPPEPTMYDQVLRHLETISHEARIPPKSQLNFGEIALATIAVCLRWGTYFAVLADRTKPIWPQTGQEEVGHFSAGRDQELVGHGQQRIPQNAHPDLLCARKSKQPQCHIGNHR